MAFFSEWALKDIRKISFKDHDGKHATTIKNIKNGNFTNGSEKVWATGTNEQRLAGFQTNETVSFTASSGAISEGGFMLNGAKVQTHQNGTGYEVEDVIRIDSATSVSIKYSASGLPGAEIGYIYKCDRAGRIDPNGTVYEQAAAVSATEFKYESKTITLPTGAFEVGEYVLVKYFPTFSSLTEISRAVGAEPFRGEARIYVFATKICENKTYLGQIVIYNAEVVANYELAFGDAAAVQDINIESVAECDEGGKYWSFFIGSEEQIVA